MESLSLRDRGSLHITKKNRFIINTIWELKNKNIFEPESWVKVEKLE